MPDGTGRAAFLRAEAAAASVGVLLALSAALHVVALYAALLGLAEGVGGALALLGAQVVLGLAIVRAADGAWYAQDLRVPFIVVYGLYGSMLAIGALLGFAEVTGQLAKAVLLYASGLVAFNLVQWMFRQPWPNTAVARVAGEPATPATVLCAALIVLACFAFAVTRGVSFGLQIDRTRVSQVYSQGWVVLMFVTGGVLAYAVAGYGALGRVGKAVTAASIGAFVAMHLALGNRREFLPLLLFGYAIVATRRGLRVGTGQILAAFAVFVLFMAIGLVRQVLLDPTLLLADPVSLFFGANEFSHPIQTLLYYASADHEPLYGATYLTWLSLFVPRAWWSGKPEGIGVQFVLDAFGTRDFMGFAYTPATEAFRNFGTVGPFLVLGLVSLALVYLVRHAAPRWRLYFLGYGLVLDFNRGEVASLMYSLTLIGAAYYAMVGLSRLTMSLGARPPLPARGASA